MIPRLMAGVWLTGHGGLECLEYREDIPVPRPGADEVLIRVAAASVNNTDVNTRIGWYSQRVKTATGAGGRDGFADFARDDASWSGAAVAFPRIQGADACGHIVAVGEGVDPARVGQRVIVASMQPASDQPFRFLTFGADCDGGFAQYATAAAAHAYAVDCAWTDVELASMPCAWSTAENQLQRGALVAGERLLITGASGGVGSAALQLARRRGARVVAVAAAAKADALRALGAETLLERDADLLAALGPESVDAVLDPVGGPRWPDLLQLLRRGGRYITSGAIAGPVVELDLRTLYLKDLRLIGCTWQPAQVFADLVGYIERGEVRPVVARTYPLAEIRQAQRDFLAKRFLGKLVLIPP